MPHLHVSLFGRPRVLFDGAAFRIRAPEAALSVLAFVALRHPDFVTREEVAFGLWPDDDEQSARAKLRRYLHLLQTALPPSLGPLFETEGHALRFHPQTLWCDVVAFRELLAAAAPSAEAVDLYTGDLLERNDEEWLASPRKELREAHLANLRGLAERSVRAGDRAAALAYYARLLQTEPWDEAAIRATMELRVAGGDRSGALALYRTFVRDLDGELGVAPSSETQALAQQITAGRVDELAERHPSPRTNLRHPLGKFFGDETSRASLCVALRTHRLVTVTGPPGIGKTTLALRAALDALEDVPDGAFLVDVSLLDRAEHLPPAIAGIVGIAASPDRTIGSLVSALHDRRMLLLLDDCDRMLDACAQVADALLAGCPHLRIIATSREILNMPGEGIVRVAPLGIPPQEQLGFPQLLAYPSAALLVDRVQSAARTVNDGDAPHIVTICRRLDGIPLALELAAARARTFSFAEIAESLDRRFLFFSTASRAVHQRHRTLRATLDWSYDLLSSGERALLARLSTFAKTWTLDAASFVCANDETEVESITDILASLVDKSFVGVEPEHGITRYHLLETIQHYAASHLDDESASALSRRHALYFRERAREIELARRGSDDDAGASCLVDVENYRKALGWAFGEGGDALLGIDLAGWLAVAWVAAGFGSEGLYWLDVALARSARDDESERAFRLWIGVANVAEELWLGERAAIAAERALTIARNRNEPRLVARSLTLLGQAAFRLGQYDEAWDVLASACAYCADAGDERGMAIARCTMGMIERARGRLEAARPYYEEHLTRRRSIGTARGISIATMNYAELEFACGNVKSAIAVAGDALEIARSRNITSIAALLQCNLGGYYLHDDRLASAGEMLREALHNGQREHAGYIVITAIEHCALLAALLDDAVRAALLGGYANLAIAAAGYARDGTERQGRARLDCILAATLRDDDRRRTEHDGSLLSQSEAVRLALATCERAISGRDLAPSHAGGLS